METLAWWPIVALWFVVWRPGMVEWWHQRHVRKMDLEELRAIRCVEDMFKGNR